MRKKILFLFLLFLPLYLKAQTTLDGIFDMLSGVIGSFVIVLAGVALVVFIWGVIKMLAGKMRGDGDEAIEKGKKHMVWGIIALFVMLSVWGIVALIRTMVGIDSGLESTYDAPSVDF